MNFGSGRRVTPLGFVLSQRKTRTAYVALREVEKSALFVRRASILTKISFVWQTAGKENLGRGRRTTPVVLCRSPQGSKTAQDAQKSPGKSVRSAEYDQGFELGYDKKFCSISCKSGEYWRGKENNSCRSCAESTLMKSA